MTHFVWLATYTKQGRRSLRKKFLNFVHSKIYTFFGMKFVKIDLKLLLDC